MNDCNKCRKIGTTNCSGRGLTAGCFEKIPYGARCQKRQKPVRVIVDPAVQRQKDIRACIRSLKEVEHIILNIAGLLSRVE